LANNNIAHTSVENEPTLFYYFINEYWATYPIRGPNTNPIYLSKEDQLPTFKAKSANWEAYWIKSSN